MPFVQNLVSFVVELYKQSPPHTTHNPSSVPFVQNLVSSVVELYKQSPPHSNHNHPPLTPPRRGSTRYGFVVAYWPLLLARV